MIGLFLLAALLIVLWIRSENRSTSPLVDMKMMRIPEVWTTNLCAMLFGFGMYVMFTTVPQFVETPTADHYGFGASVTQSGLDLLPFAAAMLLVAPLTGRLSVAFGARRVLLSGCIFSASSYVVLVFWHAHSWQILIAAGLLGIGIAMGYAAMSNLVVEAVPQSQTGIATGMNTNIRNVGGAVGAGVATSMVVSTFLPNGDPGRARLHPGLRGLGVGAPGGRRHGAPDPPAPRARAERARAGQRDLGWGGGGGGLRLRGRMMAARVGLEPVPRPLRRDAELNLERILVAAQDVFAESGYEASMERIAQRAGVGVGTLYRRFPNKESLVVAIMEMAGQRSLELVSEVLENASPAEGIFEFLRRCVGLPASLRALVSRSPHLAETHLAMVESLAGPVTRLLTNAKAAGSIRTDVTFSDIAIILLSVRAVEDRYEAGDAAARIGRQQGERHLQLLFDGLRATGSVLPHRPLSRAQLYDLLVRA